MPVCVLSNYFTISDCGTLRGKVDESGAGAAVPLPGAFGLGDRTVWFLFFFSACWSSVIICLEREQILWSGWGLLTRVIFTVQFGSRGKDNDYEHMYYSKRLFTCCPLPHIYSGSEAVWRLRDCPSSQWIIALPEPTDKSRKISVDLPLSYNKTK